MQKPEIGSTIEVDASFILGFDCGSRSWIEAVVDGYSDVDGSMRVRIGRGDVRLYSIDYLTNSHGCSWRVPIWSPERRIEVAKAMSKPLLLSDGVNVDYLSPKERWWSEWLREADGVLSYLEKQEIEQIPET